MPGPEYAYRTEFNAVPQPRPGGNRWYVRRGRHTMGPCSTQDVVEAAQDGLLAATDALWRQGFERWFLISEIDGLLPQAANAARGATTPLNHQQRAGRTAAYPNAGPDRTRALTPGITSAYLQLCAEAEAARTLPPPVSIARPHAPDLAARQGAAAPYAAAEPLPHYANGGREPARPGIQADARFNGFVDPMRAVLNSSAPDTAEVHQPPSYSTHARPAWPAPPPSPMPHAPTGSHLPVAVAVPHPATMAPGSAWPSDPATSLNTTVPFESQATFTKRMAASIASGIVAMLDRYEIRTVEDLTTNDRLHALAGLTYDLMPGALRATIHHTLGRAFVEERIVDVLAVLRAKAMSDQTRQVDLHRFVLDQTPAIASAIDGAVANTTLGMRSMVSSKWSAVTSYWSGSQLGEGLAEPQSRTAIASHAAAQPAYATFG